MLPTLFLPVKSNSGAFPKGNVEPNIQGWMDERMAFIRQIWTAPPPPSLKLEDPQDVVNALVDLLTHRKFNYVSKSKLRPIMDGVRQNLAKQWTSGQPLTFYLLLNGGYRAAHGPERSDLIFEPDHTELLLLYQIALFRSEVARLCDRPVAFHIVVNNGVAKWVNGIALAKTERYANKFRGLVDQLGASREVQVLLQSELVGFEPNKDFGTALSPSALSAQEHAMVERFLGRTCSKEEAEYRAALYVEAEAKWARDLQPLIQAHGGLVMRQVAHPDMLSFRPFPGGAIRIQNGTLGWVEHKERLQPKLVTAVSYGHYSIREIHLELPVGAQHLP